RRVDRCGQPNDWRRPCSRLQVRSVTAAFYAAREIRSRSAERRASAWPSSCRTRSRVRSSSWPIASSVHGSPSNPKRSSRIRRSRSGSASSARRTPWRRRDSSASSNGSAASRSANRSPSSPSSSAPPVELLDRPVQAERSRLDQVEERHAETAVALRDRHDEAQVRLDHAALRGRVAALDRLREDDLVGGGEQLVLADVGEEELQAVGRAAHGRGGLGGGELRFFLLLLLIGGRGGG